MKIIKYIIILILFTTTTIAVFLLTTKGNYTIKNNKTTLYSADKIFNYLKNPDNFKDWNTFSNEVVKININNVVPEKEIQFTLNFNTHETKNILEIIEENNETELKLTTIGAFSYVQKIKNLIKKPKEILGDDYFKLLSNINFKLTNVKEKFSINNTIEQRDLTRYIGIKTKTNQSDLISYITNFKDSLGKITRNSNLNLADIFTMIIPKKDTTDLHLIIATEVTNDSIYYSTSSRKYYKGIIDAHEVVKTTLNGSYEFYELAKKEHLNYIAKKNIQTNKYMIPEYMWLERNHENTKHTDDYITHLFHPIKQNN